MNTARRMIPVLIAILASTALADDNADRAAVNKTALEKLQGRWMIVSIVKRGQDVGIDRDVGAAITIKDDSVTVTTDRQGSTPLHRFIRLEANTTPLLLDWAESAQAFEERKDVVEGVYSLDGDTLQWCVNLDGDQPAKANRPAAVESKADSSTMLIKLERAKN